ncbi:MAG: hypothetical protein ACFFD5_00320 [Candidatus Thorarchaeota archaeon]
MNETRIQCFVIMPFSKSSINHSEEYWTNHYNNFLKPLIEEVPGIEAHRVEALRGDILRQIITNLVVSHIVVAELTDHNPNVFWELGVRQSFKHNTITIAEEGVQLPFDISSKATLFYNLNNDSKLKQFKERFKTAIKDCIENPNRPDSYVLETISGRGSLFEIMRLDEAKRRIEALISECKTNYNVWLEVIEISDDIEEFLNTRFVFLTSAIESLVINRYIDEDIRFYNNAEDYFRLLKNMTTRVNRLRDSKDYLSWDFLRKRKRSIGKMIKAMIDNFERIHKKLSEKMSSFSSSF